MNGEKTQLLELCKVLTETPREEWFVLDTETTSKEVGEICQMSIIDGTGFVWFNNLVKTKEPIPHTATMIHGITDEMCKDAPTWKDLRDIYAGFLKGNPVVTYGAVFDRKMMHQSAECWNMPKYDWKERSKFLCAMEAFAEFYGDWNSMHKSYRWQRLFTAAKYCKVEAVNLHSALGDCRATLGVVNYMLDNWQNLKIDQSG